MVTGVFTDRTSIYNHRRPHLATTMSSPSRFDVGADAKRPRVRIYTVGILFGSAQTVDSNSSLLCSFLARFLVVAVHRLHTPRSALMHNEAHSFFPHLFAHEPGLLCKIASLPFRTLIANPALTLCTALSSALTRTSLVLSTRTD